MSIFHKFFSLTFATIRDLYRSGSFDVTSPGLSFFGIPVGIILLVVFGIWKTVVAPRSRDVIKGSSLKKGLDLSSEIVSDEASSQNVATSGEQETRLYSGSEPSSADFASTKTSSLAQAEGISESSQEPISSSISQHPSEASGETNEGIHARQVSSFKSDVSLSAPETWFSNDPTMLQHIQNVDAQTTTVYITSHGPLASDNDLFELEDSKKAMGISTLPFPQKAVPMFDSPTISPAFLKGMDGTIATFESFTSPTSREIEVAMGDADEDSDDDEEFIYTGVDYKVNGAPNHSLTKVDDSAASTTNSVLSENDSLVDLDTDDDDEFIYTGVDSDYFLHSGMDRKAFLFNN